MDKKTILDTMPEGVTAQVRTDGRTRYVFLLNFTGEVQTVDDLTLGPYGSRVLTGGMDKLNG